MVLCEEIAVRQLLCRFCNSFGSKMSESEHEWMNQDLKRAEVCAIILDGLQELQKH